MDPAVFAKELARVSGLNVTYDKYRKYEILDPKKGSLLPHNLIYAFCEVARIHPYSLLAGDPFPKAVVTQSERRKAS